MFYLSGSRLAMEKFDLHFLETGLVSQCLSKTYNPWETCKYPSTTDLPNLEKHQVQVSFTSTAKMFVHIYFKSQTVDNLLLA